MIAFIAVKGTSVRCPNKNKVLLPYVVKKFKGYLDVVVVTDSSEIASMCESTGVKFYMECKEPPHDEFYAIYDCIRKNNIQDEELLILPATQPFKSLDTVFEVANYNMEGLDMVTTYTIVPNRSIFVLNSDDTFKYDSYHRKGSMCEPLKMVDGNIYKLTKSSLERIALSNDTNHAIWGESKIAYIENKCQLFLDVDTPSDLEIFKDITEHKL